MKLLKSIKLNILGSGVLCLALGVLLVIYPGTSLTVVCKAVGAIVFLSGLGMVLGCLRKEEPNVFSKIGVVIGCILAIVGGFLFLSPQKLISVIPIILGVLLVYHGMCNVKQAFELHRYKDRSWWLPVLIAASIIALGVLIMRNPFETIEMLMRIVGICLIYDGLTNLVLVGLFVKSIRNFQRMEAAEDEMEVIEEK